MKLPFVNTPEFHGNVVVSSSAKFGKNCVVWQFATICDDVVIGDNCVIGSGVWIGTGTVIGNGTRIQHGAFIAKNSVIGSGVFIGPLAALIDDKHPVAGMPYHAKPPKLMDYCSIGAKAVVMPGVTVGERAMVGAGAVCVQDVQADAVSKGVPARSSS